MLRSDIRQVWTATTTTDRDRKELLRTLLEEVVLNLKRAEGHAHLTLRWRGADGLFSRRFGVLGLLRLDTPDQPILDGNLEQPRLCSTTGYARVIRVIKAVAGKTAVQVFQPHSGRIDVLVMNAT